MFSAVPLLVGRTRASEFAREQAAGQTRVVVATSAAQVPTKAAAQATEEVPNTTAMDSGALCEDEGEWAPPDLQSSSSSKRHKHDGQPHKDVLCMQPMPHEHDSSAKEPKHTLQRAPSSSLLQAPLLIAPNSPTYSSYHSLLFGSAAPTRSNSDMGQQVSDPDPHTGMPTTLPPPPGPPHTLRSMASKPAPMRYTSSLSSQQLDEDNTHCTNLGSLSPPCSGGAGIALQNIQHPTQESQSEWCECTNSEAFAKIPGYLICLSGGEVNAFLASTGETVLSVHDIFHCMGHTYEQAGVTLSAFMHRNKQEVLPLQQVKARKVGASGCPKLFASADVTLCIIGKYWAHAELRTKQRLCSAKELLVSDLRALIPKVRDVAKPKSSPRVLETSELSCEEDEPCTGDASKAPPHRTVSQDVSSCRLDPVPVSSTNDPLWKKKNDLFTSLINVINYLALDSDETTAVMHTMHSMTDAEVSGYMGTTHLCMRHAWNGSDQPVMRNLIKGLVQRGH